MSHDQDSTPTTASDPTARRHGHTGARETARSAAASLRRGARALADTAVALVRRGNRRRITLRGKGGEVWLRLPLTLAALLVLVAMINWLALLVLVLVVGFAAGAQMSIERVTGDAVAPSDRPDAPHGAV